MARIPAWLPAMLLFAMLRLCWPGGYAGGSGDEWHYLQATRCLVDHGWCVPQDHWSTRLPLLYPSAAALALLGESRWSIGLVPLLYTVAAIVLVALLVERRFGRRAAAFAAVALVLTPVIAIPALQPGVDNAELAWLLAALLSGSIAVERRDRRAAAIAGFLLALAVMTRPTALVMLPILAVAAALALRREVWRLALPAGAAFTLPLVLEAVAYAVSTGDPVHGWALSLHHTRIVSAELPASVDLSRSAILNLDFIRHWRRSMGIEVHWSVDWLLNLVAHPHAGLTVIGAAALMLVHRSRLPDGARWIGHAAIAAAAHVALLVFVLAVDPKPRMFLPELAFAAAVIGVASAAAWRHRGTAVPVALFALMALRSTLLSYDAPDRGPIIAAGDRLARDIPGLAVEEQTRSVLALSPAAMRLPSQGRSLLVLTDRRCRDLGGMQVRHEARLPRVEPAIIAQLRRRRVLLAPAPVASLCVLSADRGASPRPSAARRSRQA